MTPEERIASGIRKALASCGIEASWVKVTDYDPQVFGNHVAHVETTTGVVQIIFDRQYELNFLESGIASEREPEIKAALSREFSAAIDAGL